MRNEERIGCIILRIMFSAIALWLLVLSYVTPIYEHSWMKGTSLETLPDADAFPTLMLLLFISAIGINIAYFAMKNRKIYTILYIITLVLIGIKVFQLVKIYGN